MTFYLNLQYVMSELFLTPYMLSPCTDKSWSSGMAVRSRNNFLMPTPMFNRFQCFACSPHSSLGCLTIKFTLPIVYCFYFVVVEMSFPLATTHLCRWVSKWMCVAFWIFRMLPVCPSRPLACMFWHSTRMAQVSFLAFFTLIFIFNAKLLEFHLVNSQIWQTLR